MAAVQHVLLRIWRASYDLPVLFAATVTGSRPVARAGSHANGLWALR